MNEIKVFDNEQFGRVRTILRDNEPWFAGKDVAEILKYERATKAIVDRVDEEDRIMIDGKTQSQFGIELGQRGGWIINESGLYSLILGSKLPSAKAFKRWITHEVIPSIRKNGIYATDVTVDRIISDPDFGIQLLMQLKDERSKRAALENTVAVQSQQIAELSPKASYYDLILQSQGAVSISKIAKDYGKSAIWMNQKLSELGVQYYQGHMWLLYQKYAEQGYTQSKSYPIVRKDGANDCVMNTCWTQKGRLFLYELLKRNGILPLIEKEEFSA